ncbi:hypothetical protein BGX34_007905 [Mortierella sp. NVP85]|nr:hypothetical protein BGX34_007905 [Mortierella sp. NVP85]
MGTLSRSVSVHSPGTGLPHPTHRSSLKAPTQTRWPVSLNQLATFSLDDDSDLDRSFTDDKAPKGGVGSVKLLRMLKDSDDESNSGQSTQSKLKRPMSMSAYSGLQTPQQRSQQLKGVSVTRSSSMRVGGAQAGGPSAGGLAMSQRTNNAPAASSQDMERIFSEANAIAKRLGSSASGPVDSRGTVVQNKGVPGIRGPAVKTGLRPGVPNPSLVPSGPSAGVQVQAKSRLLAPSRPPPPNPALGPKQRLSHPGTATGGQRLDPRQVVQKREQPSQGPSIRPQGTLNVLQASPAVRKLGGLQPPLSRPSQLNQPIADNTIATTMLPSQPGMVLSMGAAEESESSRIIRELNEELERWKIEAEEHRKERVAAEVWRKQISNLERDLEVALDSLQSAEVKVIESRLEQETARIKFAEYEKAIEDLQFKAEQEATNIKFSENEKLIESLKADFEALKSTKEKELEEATISHNLKLEGIESRNKELEKRLEQAQHEIDELELQVVPAELRDIHQALFSANQDLEEKKRANEKLNTELEEAKANVVRAQEDSSQLLIKISQLQDTIAGHLGENNTLKEALKEHEKCQENAEANETRAHYQQLLAQEQDQKLKLEQALQEHQIQLHQVQQQVQMQQTTLLQQQTEIVSLRAVVEVEQKQAALLQQRLQEEQRNSLQFNRRVSGDGDMNSSFIMADTTMNSSMSSGIMPMNSTDATMGAMGGASTGVRGAQVFSSSGPNTMPPMNSMMASGLHSIRSFEGSPLTSQLGMTPMQPISSQSQASAAALPPTGVPSMVPAASVSSAGISDVEPKPRMIHHGSSGSISGIVTSGSRMSIHSDSMPSPAATNQTVEELTAQLQSLLKDKEKLQADLSKIPISGGGPMARRKAELLEEQMDTNERAISRVRYSIRMRS